MEWKKVKLEDISQIIAGQSPESKYYNQEGDGLPFFQGKADFGLETPNVRYWCTVPTKIAYPKDILLSVRAPVGPTNICNLESCIGRGLAAIRVGSKLNHKYLYWWFKSFEEKLADKGNGSTFSSITSKDIKELEVPLPPLEIQQQIADTLDKADALRRKDEELLKKYDELARAIFYDMFGDPIENEKGWEVKNLKDLCIQITDGTHFSPPSVSSGVPYITAKHIKKNGVDFYSNPTFVAEEHHKEIYARCKPSKGDILYIKDGATTGIAAINNYDFEFSMLSSLALIKPKTDVLNNMYLKYWLNNEKVKNRYINEFMAGAAIQRFTLTKINQFKINLPPIHLQQSFNLQMDIIEKSYILQLTTKGHNNHIFNGLLSKYFS